METQYQPGQNAEKKSATKIAAERLAQILNRRIALWVMLLLLCLSFAGGTVFAGRYSLAELNEKMVIKGVGAETASAVPFAGSVTNTDELPSYLKKDVDFSLYWSTWNLIKERGYKDVPETKLFYGSLQGLVAGLEDPYSVFLTPSDATQFSDDLKGNFDGIGAEVAVKNNKLIIVTPLDESPAMKAGLKPKDWIVKIGSTSTEGMSSNEAVSIIRGKAGTKVKLTIFREGVSGTKEIEITRAPIAVKSLSWEFISGGAIARIKVRQFNDDTIPLLDQAIKDITHRNGIKGIILDLRGNPGGYLDAAVKMAGEWDGKSVVVTEKDKNGIANSHIAYIESRLANYKTMVLVDGGSASASEIVSGALKDWGKATIVGMKTFGKGSVQELDSLPDGSQVKLTIAKWFTPKGANIDEQGIEPDVKIDLTDNDYNNDKDPQLDKAIELLR